LSAVIHSDYSERNFIDEVLMIGSINQSFRASELKTMDWDDYEYLVNRVRDEIKKGNDGE